MKEEIRIFGNEELNIKVRTVQVNNKPYFVGKDIAKTLGYSNTTDAIRRHCRGSVKHAVTDNQGVIQQMSLITEGNIYRLIIKSRLDVAEKFESWIMEEVLPQIRITGGYFFL